MIVLEVCFYSYSER